MDRKVSITAHRQGDSKELANSSHTLPCCLSMHRSRVEAAWKQVRSSLEYACSMNKVLLCVPLVVRSELEEGYEWHVSTNMRENDVEVGFVASRTYVHRPMSQCLLWPFNITIGSIVYKFLIQLSLN